MCDPTDQHREEAARFLADHDYGIPVELHVDRYSTTAVVQTPTPRIHLRGLAAALGLDDHITHDHCGAWETYWVDVPLPSTRMRLTTGPLISAQRRAA